MGVGYLAKAPGWLFDGQPENKYRQPARNTAGKDSTAIKLASDPSIT
jgi:hypothetical protein